MGLIHKPTKLFCGVSSTKTADKIESLSEEQRNCIENCNEAAEVCEWCADECLGDSDMEECARLCRDVADLTSLHARFMARSSRHRLLRAWNCTESYEP